MEGTTTKEIEAARHLLWFHGYRSEGYEPGGFTTSLITTLTKADMTNRERLLSAFPEFRWPVMIMSAMGGDVLEETVREVAVK